MGLVLQSVVLVPLLVAASAMYCFVLLVQQDLVLADQTALQASQGSRQALSQLQYHHGLEAQG